MTIQLDLKELTLNGKPMQWEDIVVLLSSYTIKHPEDAVAQDVLAYIYTYHMKIFCHGCKQDLTELSDRVRMADTDYWLCLTCAGKRGWKHPIENFRKDT